MKFGNVCCGNSECKKTLGYFPADVVPNNVELYCEGCMEELEDQTDLKEDLNG